MAHVVYQSIELIKGFQNHLGSSKSDMWFGNRAHLKSCHLHPFGTHNVRVGMRAVVPIDGTRQRLSESLGFIQIGYVVAEL